MTENVAGEDNEDVLSAFALYERGPVYFAPPVLVTGCALLRLVARFCNNPITPGQL